MMFSRTDQHPYFDYQMWQDDVRQGDTQLGYAEWVESNVEQKQYELDDAEKRFEGCGGRDIALAEEIDELRAMLDTSK